jgi:hypothetical protein
VKVEEPFIQWLLGSSIATIRYQTRTQLLGLPVNDPAVLKDYQSIQDDGAVPAILDRQTAPGQWPYINHFYTPKYVSTHWSLMLLEELKVDPHNERFQAGAKYMLAATHKDILSRLSSGNHGWTCLWGNIIRYELYAQRWEDERLQSMLELTASSLEKHHCQCQYNSDNPCSWGAARGLWALAAIPQQQRSIRVENAIQQGVDFLLASLNQYLQQKPIHPGEKTNPLWRKLSFPIFYHADILFVLRVLAELNNLQHPQAQPALTWLQNLRKPNGQWRGSSPFRQRTWPEMGAPEETSRWVSLQAAAILHQAGRL